MKEGGQIHLKLVTMLNKYIKCDCDKRILSEDNLYIENALAYHKPQVLTHGVDGQATTSNTICKKCIKTSPGGQEIHIVIPNVQLHAQTYATF